MKKILFIAIAIFIAISAVAQNSNIDYLILKNGTVIQGTIVSIIENQTVTIRNTNGDTFTYPMIEINRISQGKSLRLPSPDNTNEYIEYTTHDKGFWYAIEAMVGYSFHLNNDNLGLTELNAVAGYRVNEYLRGGIGLGVRYYLNNDKVRYSDINWSFPLFFDIRGNLISSEYRDVVPFYSFDIGGCIRDGFMISPTIGVRIGEKRSAFLLGLSYIGQSMKEKRAINNAIVANQEFVSLLALKIGYEF